MRDEKPQSTLCRRKNQICGCHCSAFGTAKCPNLLVKFSKLRICQTQATETRKVYINSSRCSKETRQQHRKLTRGGNEVHGVLLCCRCSCLVIDPSQTQKQRNLSTKTSKSSSRSATTKPIGSCYLPCAGQPADNQVWKRWFKSGGSYLNCDVGLREELAMWIKANTKQ
eukprot:4251464-Amphidinium_carterae.1